MVTETSQGALASLSPPPVSRQPATHPGQTRGHSRTVAHRRVPMAMGSAMPRDIQYMATVSLQCEREGMGGRERESESGDIIFFLPTPSGEAHTLRVTHSHSVVYKTNWGICFKLL